MQCPGCGSFPLDVTSHCDGCGLQLSVQQEIALRASLPAPKTRAIQEDKFDYAIRRDVWAGCGAS